MEHKKSAWVFTVASLVGVLASLALAIEKYLILVNPFYLPSCSIDEKINCATVMNSSQSELLGFPNPYLGLVAFSMVFGLSIGILAGAKYAAWLWSGLLAGLFLAIIFVLWLAYQSIFSIGALCPYCIVTWISTVLLFIATLRLRKSPRAE